MLNRDKERELAYVIKVDAIEPIPGKDRVEAAVVGGWKTMVHKGVFQPGDIGIYFEIDSKTPAKKPFEFLEKYHYKIKTQKFKSFYSQGLLMHPADFDWHTEVHDNELVLIDDKDNKHRPNDLDSMFLTKQLGITYAVEEDNKRKANSVDKYKKMAQRHPELFKKNWARWMMKREWGKKMMFFFFGKKKDARSGWPSWVVKTDEERVQNLPCVFENPDWHDYEWMATEKIDGTSTTFTLKRGSRLHHNEYYVCSRNVCFDTPEKGERCFYSSNVYLEMSEKYHIREVLEDILATNKDLDYVTIQGETYGDGIQKRTYSTNPGEHRLAVFNLIYGFKDGATRRLNPLEMEDVLDDYKIPCVPIITPVFKMPNDCDTLLLMATGKSKIDGLPREGIVFRDRLGERSFKAVSNEFLMEFHQ